MKRRLLPLALSLALVLSLAACKKPAPPTPSPTLTPTPVVTPTLTPTPTPTSTPAPSQSPVWGDQVIARTFHAGDGTEVMSVSYALPFVQNTDQCPAGTAINNWYKNEGAERIAAAEESYEMVVADYDVSSASDFPFQPTKEEMTYKVTRQDTVISVARELYINYGGAHPFVGRLSEQFDGVTGAQLGFADFFTDPDKVLALVLDAFLAQPDIAPEVSSGTLSASAVSGAFQPEDFYLTDDGYVFWIQGGNLPAFNSPIEVTIPYATLEDLTVYG